MGLVSLVDGHRQDAREGGPVDLPAGPAAGRGRPGRQRPSWTNWAIPTLWIPEAVGREVLTNAALLLGATERLNVATGIASIWARDGMATAAGQRTLCEAFGGRFLLGLGVSHQPMVEGMRGAVYDRPLERMRCSSLPWTAPSRSSPAPS